MSTSRHLFNLFLPAYPLDGGRVLANVLVMHNVEPNKAAKICVGITWVVSFGLIVYGKCASQLGPLSIIGAHPTLTYRYCRGDQLLQEVGRVQLCYSGPFVVIGQGIQALAAGKQRRGRNSRALSSLSVVLPDTKQALPAGREREPERGRRRRMHGPWHGHIAK